MVSADGVASGVMEDSTAACVAVTVVVCCRLSVSAALACALPSHALPAMRSL